jgi:hypothetical protein
VPGLADTLHEPTVVYVRATVTSMNEEVGLPSDPVTVYGIEYVPSGAVVVIVTSSPLTTTVHCVG